MDWGLQIRPVCDVQTSGERPRIARLEKQNSARPQDSMNFLQRSEGIEQMFEDLDRRHSVERLLIKLRVLETALEHPDAGWVRRSPVRDVDPDGFEVSASAKEEITPPAPEVEETARFHELHEPREPILSFPPAVFAVVNRLTLAAI